jgi:hypothetical protein
MRNDFIRVEARCCDDSTGTFADIGRAAGLPIQARGTAIRNPAAVPPCRRLKNYEDAETGATVPCRRALGRKDATQSPCCQSHAWQALHQMKRDATTSPATVGKRPLFVAQVEKKGTGVMGTEVIIRSQFPPPPFSLVEADVRCVQCDQAGRFGEGDHTRTMRHTMATNAAHGGVDRQRSRRSAAEKRDARRKATRTRVRCATRWTNLLHSTLQDAGLGSGRVTESA